MAGRQRRWRINKSKRIPPKTDAEVRLDEIFDAPIPMKKRRPHQISFCVSGSEGAILDQIATDRGLKSRAECMRTLILEEAQRNNLPFAFEPRRNIKSKTRIKSDAEIRAKSIVLEVLDG